ncbi:hypothetical protein F5884DRAFT_333320 [Xylogone sp. PMI_703]|nr:hypothetical protein F5884DRAFT_333320 [Xylogone sp. PMI_703]
MLSSIRVARSKVASSYLITRHLTTAAVGPISHGPKKEGDISSVFQSLSGQAEPLPPRIADLKTQLVSRNPTVITSSWNHLLSKLRSEVQTVASARTAIIPTINFSDIHNHTKPRQFKTELQERGVAVIRNVVPEQQALQWKEEVKSYIAVNPSTKGFPHDRPAVFELYWSPAQIKARAHPNMLEAQRFIMSFWHSKSPDAMVSTEFPVSYADRLRICQPSESGFALGPHVDGGSVERWEPQGYGLGGVYDKIWEGKWDEYDPWESSSRLGAVSDLYNGAGACSMFRMFQGWLSMSVTGPGEKSLMVNPMLKTATAYFLLRPFFFPRNSDTASLNYLDEDNWILAPQQDTALQGAALGCGQELFPTLHPHLHLDKTMVHVPKVRPGDYVLWHCDTIHAVDKDHKGNGDSSVMYIPACPLTEANASYLVKQRDAFLRGTPGPDFPGGMGESGHIGRPGAREVIAAGGIEAMRAMGLEKWNVEGEDAKDCRELLEKANTIIS